MCLGEASDAPKWIYVSFLLAWAVRCQETGGAHVLHAFDQFCHFGARHLAVSCGDILSLPSVEAGRRDGPSIFECDGCC